MKYVYITRCLAQRSMNKYIQICTKLKILTHADERISTRYPTLTFTTGNIYYIKFIYFVLKYLTKCNTFTYEDVEKILY